MSFFEKVDQLACLPNPYAPITEVEQSLFTQAMHEADVWHKAHNESYAKLWADDINRPVIPVTLFKQVDLTTPVEGEGLWLQSSGTTQRNATKVFFDHPSLARMEKAIFNIFIANGMFSQQPARFLLLSPDPRKGSFPGYATSFLKFTAAAPIQELVFAVNEQGIFDVPLAIATLERWSQEKTPIFIFGLTVFFEQLASALTEQIQFKGKIKGITGGGWKGLTKTMERPEIINKLQQYLVASELDIRDIFGLTEHPIQYLSCPFGYFHQVIYSRMLIMGADGKSLAKGEEGLIRLQNPFYASLPAQDILTEDSGYLADNCPCGNPHPYLYYLGRVTRMQGICAHEASR